MHHENGAIRREALDRGQALPAQVEGDAGRVARDADVLGADRARRGFARSIHQRFARDHSKCQRNPLTPRLTRPAAVSAKWVVKRSAPEPAVCSSILSRDLRAGSGNSQ